MEMNILDIKMSHFVFDSMRIVSTSWYGILYVYKMKWNEVFLNKTNKLDKFLEIIFQ